MPVEARGRTRRGFTLLELLVALALLGLLSAGLAGGIAFGNRVWQRTAASARTVQGWARLDLTLRRQLGSTVSAGALRRFEGQPPLFAGERDGFSWVTRSPSAALPPGLYGQRVRRIGTGRRAELVLESWPLADPARVRRSPLLEAAPVGFRYFGAATPDAPARWHPRWAAGPLPPRLVEIAGPGLPLLRYEIAREALD